MTRSNQLNTLLMEIMIAVLFFALCSTVILDVFVGAHNQSVRAGRRRPSPPRRIFPMGCMPRSSGKSCCLKTGLKRMNPACLRGNATAIR